MQFESFPYARPDVAGITADMNRLLDALPQARHEAEQEQLLEQLFRLRAGFSSMYNLCYVRYTADTADAFYEAENSFFDEHLPAVEALNNRLYKSLLEAPFRASLEQKHGRQLFTLASLALKTFKPDILEDLHRENVLSSQYTKLKAGAELQFEGQTYTLANIQPLELSADRDVRRRAAHCRWQFFENHSAEIEGIFDEMVGLRTKMARKIGYPSFVEMGYARMRRSDYTPEKVAVFRKQVKDLIVPLCTELYERQRRRLGLDELFFYDEEYKFAGGNPKPNGCPDEIVAHAATMYQGLSPETNHFFQDMQDRKLLDLVNRKGKANGGYCTYIEQFKAPFIFSNFNGTSGDIDVLTHEAGHAFQVWLSGARFPVEEYHWPTNDAAEIHSMSMEFFTWPWMNLFFGKDTDKYYFLHLSNALLFLPYGVAVDAFQHIVYENPDMTAAERNAAWRNLEREFLPHRQYDGLAFLENGGYWQKQTHIFTTPFYYIDYALAQICAFQFWVKDRRDHTDAWQHYLQLCKAGGSRSFLELVSLAGLRSPFDPDCVESVIHDIKAYLDGVEDAQF